MRALVAGGLVTLAARGAGAQGAQAPPLAPGTRVRVVATALGSGPRVASVLGQRGDTLAVRPEDTADSVALPLGQIARLEVSGGAHTRVLKGLGVGVLAGVAVGAIGGVIIGAPGYADCHGQGGCSSDPARGASAAVYGILFGLLGAPIGGVVGAVWRAERWDRVLVAGRSARLRVRPERRGGVALAVAF